MWVGLLVSEDNLNFVPSLHFLFRGFCNAVFNFDRLIKNSGYFLIKTLYFFLNTQ